jgi:Protein of unknown function (DUF1367)
MATEIILKKCSTNMDGSLYYALLPCDNLSAQALHEMTDGEQVKAVLTRPRNLKFHRLFFGLLQVVFESQNVFPTLEGMLDSIKVALGHFDEIKGFDGTVYIKPRSVSFASMDAKSFREFYDRALDLILTRILPLTEKKDLERRVYEILGERYGEDADPRR